MRSALVILGLVAASPAAADVTASAETSFTLTEKVTVAAPVKKVWATLVSPASWWSGAHTWSGHAENLSLAPRPGGCWCEKLGEDGGVEHMRVVFVVPGETLRLTGGLGPLQAMPATGVLTVMLTPAPGDLRSTLVVFTYAVAGAPGLGALATPVDGVLAAQVTRLKAAAER